MKKILVAALALSLCLAQHTPKSGEVGTPVGKEVTSKVPETTVSTPMVELEPALEVEVEVVELWGSCRVTAYCPCEKCCGEWALKRPVDPETGERIVYGASGAALQSGASVAANLPFGTRLRIPALGEDKEFVVEDRTADWVQEKYGGMTVDIFISNHQECYEFLAGAVDWMDVYIIEE